VLEISSAHDRLRWYGRGHASTPIRGQSACRFTQDAYELTISLIDQQIITPDGSVMSFDIDPFLKERLVTGWDQIGLTLRHEAKIVAYEKKEESPVSHQG
jgi:3-isopropylmalate dehydratase small subunit